MQKVMLLSRMIRRMDTDTTYAALEELGFSMNSQVMALARSSALTSSFGESSAMGSVAVRDMDTRMEPSWFCTSPLRPKRVRTRSFISMFRMARSTATLVSGSSRSPKRRSLSLFQSSSFSRKAKSLFRS